MLRWLPILLPILYALALWRFSLWRTKAELDARSTELADPGLLRLVREMARAMDLPRLRVFVYEVEPVNGLAAPDGRIFLTRGFLNRRAAGEVSDAELASVIAHELGHVALGHTRRRMIDFSGRNAVAMALAALLNRFLPGLGMVIANGLVTVLAARLSRQDEYEADAWASALLIKAGIGTAPQKALFAKLDRMTGVGGVVPVWLRSHPRTADRIAAIEAKERSWAART